MKPMNNPIITRPGICDPHVLIWNDVLYLYTGHDANIMADDYDMDHWEVWCSRDGHTFEHRQTIDPTQTYLGASRQCWALDVAARNGKFYLYVSNGNQDIGVLVSDSPDGPFVDALGAPLLTTVGCKTMAYDPHVVIDQDDRQTPYLVFGGPSWAYGSCADGYYIARLTDDMLALDETPRKIQLNHRGDDKVAIHYYNGNYYLSFASHYAISPSIYGPFSYQGNTGVSKDHGTFFEWNHQWFHAFTIFDPTLYHRGIGMCYVHYKQDGEMVSDTLTVQYGIGQYDARWHRIDAENYMKASRWMKREGYHGGFEVADMTVGDYLVFPNVHHLPIRGELYCYGRRETPQACQLEIRQGGITGPCLGMLTPSYIERPYTYDTCSATLHHDSAMLDLCFVVVGEPGASFTLDYFRVCPNIR